MRRCIVILTFYVFVYNVNHITNQIVKKITKLAKDKLGKKDINIRPSYIKMRLWVFVNALVENPSFSSQTKDVLTSKDFGRVLAYNICRNCSSY